MKTMSAMPIRQIEKFARFLEEHPGFSPLMAGIDAVVYGFQIGECFLTLTEMEALVAAEPHFDAEQVARLLCPVAPKRGS